MNLEQAERRFRELQKQHERGQLSDDVFRVEVAKLLRRDERGTFWMIDAASGAWFCNRGEGWTPGDPHAEPPTRVHAANARRAKRRGLTRWLPVSIVLLILLGAVAGLALWQGIPVSLFPPAPTQIARIQVSIASPADDSQITLGQVVAIESTLAAGPDLPSVARVEVAVNGQAVGAQTVQPQADQTSLPLSQQWRPTAVGEHKVTVTAYSDGGDPLGTASITLNVMDAPNGLLPEPDCVPDAAFMAHVTIPAGTVFPPEARMDKTWQVRNSGSCAWGVGYQLVLVGGESLGAPSSIPVQPTAAGELADLAVTFWAPADPDAYTNVWQLQAPDGRFFGPKLSLSIHVEPLAEKSSSPAAPANLQATFVDEGKAVRLMWEDRSDDEDAFRIYREDVEASIGLAPANSEQFVDGGVACGRTYRYTVVAFNAAGASPVGESVEVSLPPCTTADTAPTLLLTVVPTQVVSSGTFTVTFQASDDVKVAQVMIQGQETGIAEIDAGRVFTCAHAACSGNWSVSWAREISTTLTLVGVAQDSAGQESEPALVTVTIRPAEE